MNRAADSRDPSFSFASTRSLSPTDAPQRPGGCDPATPSLDRETLRQHALEAQVAPAVSRSPAETPTATEADRTRTGTPVSRSEPRANQVPDSIPARMLNEFVYCPRLFYYEFVEGVFVASADTERGVALHARVDQGTGAVPPPSPANPPPTANSEIINQKSEILHSRSVQLGSKTLGVTAKLDLLEIRGVPTDGVQGELFGQFEVCPVDYKAGAPRDGEENRELWPADRMQLGLQMLLLRENGYTCREGVIYYRATKQRVRLPWTDDLEAWVREQVATARHTAAGPIPPPLVSSPKCVRCSLAPVCLPDETQFLSNPQTSSLPPNHKPELRTHNSEVRRLIAARDDTRALYLNTPGLRVGRKDETLTIKDREKLLDEVRLNDLTHVALFGNIQISTQAIQALCHAEIPIGFFSGGGWFYGITRGHGLKNVFLRIEQFSRANDAATCLELARRFVHGKIRNHRTLLMRNHVEPPPRTLDRLKQFAADALAAPSVESLLGTEGAAAAEYFGQFAGMIKAEPEVTQTDPTAPAPQFDFNFTHRNRRPPADPINALLSLAYSLLSRDCTVAALAVGVDPYVGFFHQPRFGRPALALDLMEEFRPLIAESSVLTAVNNRVITPKDFVTAGQAVNLSADGRKRFFQVYEQRINALLTHPVFDYKVSYRRALELQARVLARVLTGEIDEYLPLTTR